MNWNKKTAALLAAAMASTLLLGGCGQTKIGYLDPARIEQEAPQLKAMEDEGNQKLQEAQKEAEEAMQNADGKSEEEMQKASQDAQRKLMSLSQQYSTRMQQTLENAVEEIAQEQKLDTVVYNVEQQKTVIQGGVDVTDAVIQKLQ